MPSETRTSMISLFGSSGDIDGFDVAVLVGDDRLLPHRRVMVNKVRVWLAREVKQGLWLGLPW